ncbi:DUF6801 domain-containing protein [Streptomyces celluloflavus]|uniref:DUF6801 domain-containing protein n=1 Tax=Streptomyces celluloflavus TaxID=58344 RepID=UPI0036B96887
MNGRRNAARSKTRVVLRVATAAGIIAGAMGVSGAGAAFAHPVSRTLNYTCSAYRLNRTVPMVIHSDIPDSVVAGKSIPKFPLDATTTVSKEDAHLIHIAIGDLKSIEGTVDANAELHSPDGDFNVPVHFNIKKVTLPDSDRAFAVKATGTTPSRTFHKPGNVQIAVGDLTLKLAGQTANGETLGPINVGCKLNAHPRPVVASFKVVGAGKAAGSPASGTSGAASAGASALPASMGDGTGRGTIANTGQGTKDLTLLAVGALVAGGGLFLLSSRAKRRRHAGDDG